MWRLITENARCAAMDERERAALAANLRRARHARGWSQYELARQSGIHQPDISDIERLDQGINPTMDKLAALSSALGVSLSDLFYPPSPTVLRPEPC